MDGYHLQQIPNDRLCVGLVPRVGNYNERFAIRLSRAVIWEEISDWVILGEVDLRESREIPILSTQAAHGQGKLVTNIN